MVSAKGIIGLIVGFILVFRVLASTFSPLESAAIALNTSIAGSTLEGVSGLVGLPAVAILLFLLVAIFGIIMVAVNSADL